MPDRLNPGESLLAGDLMTSQDGRYTLIMQQDGNLVKYGPNGDFWQSATADNWNSHAAMQGDGNFVIYTPAGTAIWARGGAAGAALILQNDGRMIIGGAIIV
jgi:hypothetical protein